MRAFLAAALTSAVLLLPPTAQGACETERASESALTWAGRELHVTMCGLPTPCVHLHEESNGLAGLQRDACGDLPSDTTVF